MRKVPDRPVKMESPWSTPTQSEIGEAEAALNGKSNDLFDGLDTSLRELGRTINDAI